MKVSIIMPVYNKLPYIQKSIESICQQTYTDWECLVVDDGSTDGSGKLIDDMVGRDARFIVVHQINAGVSMARNRAISKATGIFLAFLDADDWWSPLYLEKMVGMMKQCDRAGIIGSNYVKVRNGKEYTFFDEVPTGYIEYFKLYNSIAQPLWTGSVMIRREVMESVRLTSEDFRMLGKEEFREDVYFKPWLKIGEDFDMWVRIAIKYPVAFLNEGIAYYNYDQPVTLRETGKLYGPENNMLFNLQWLEPYEKENLDYKALVDRLRVTSLVLFVDNPQYSDLVKQELKKIDWSKQSYSARLPYLMPIWMIRLKKQIKKIGSCCKQRLRLR